jgi:CRP-like cAMP-binding protein
MLELLRRNLAPKVSLTDAEFDLFAAKTRHRSLRKKEIALLPGEVCQYASFVVKGAFRGYLLNEKDEEKTLLLGVEDWWMVDLYSYMTRTPSRITIEAVEPCELLQMTLADLEELYETVPKIERFIRLMAQNAFIASQSRLMDLMTNTTDHRYEHFIERYPHFFQRFPQYMIASFLNVSPEHLSAVRARMARRK